MDHPIRKRSIRVDGRNTSISLEDPFWDHLIGMAKARELTLPQMIEKIAAEKPRNLSSACRVRALQDATR